MKPIDFRNETWDQIQGRLEGLRRQVYRALDEAGPCTTRELAARSGIDLLNVRPRVTELVTLGLVELANPEPGGGEGIYRAVPVLIARAQFQKRKEQAMEAQMPLL